MRKLSLTPEDRDALQKILKAQSERAQKPITLNKLVNEWVNFVATIERGYNESIYEYLNDLSTRDLLQEILDNVDPTLVAKLMTVIEPSDRRFFASVRHDKNTFKIKQKELLALLNKWDPIGVHPEGQEDEYDCFVWPILSILQSGKGKNELVNFLNRHLEEHIGLEPRAHNSEEFADQIIHWWRSNKS